jgi:hypothetical protein
MERYSGANPVARLVARVTVDFFDRYVLGQTSTGRSLPEQFMGCVVTVVLRLQACADGWPECPQSGCDLSGPAA